jgi:hypothetical protein
VRKIGLVLFATLFAFSCKAAKDINMDKQYILNKGESVTLFEHKLYYSASGHESTVAPPGSDSPSEVYEVFLLELKNLEGKVVRRIDTYEGTPYKIDIEGKKVSLSVKSIEYDSKIELTISQNRSSKKD